MIARNLNALWFFQRQSAVEVQDELVDIILTRSAPGFSQVIEEGTNYTVYVWCTTKVSSIVVAHPNYPERAARQIFRRLEHGECQDQSSLDQLLAEATTPAKLDKLGQIEAELNETRLILLDNIDKVLARGEKLDELLAKSEHLSDSSKTFLSRSRKLNRCCVLS